jgi:hypothetical protein
MDPGDGGVSDADVGGAASADSNDPKSAPVCDPDRVGDADSRASDVGGPLTISSSC